ncbi:MAG: hypothetical protein QM790_18895 [Nibricoccus sp.]
MKSPISHSLEIFSRELAARLQDLSSWSSPGAGFSALVLKLSGSESLLTTKPVDWTVPELIHDEAPGLATIGYRLAGGPVASSSALLAKWSEGFGRVKERDPLPRDRQTFLHRPVELLGIMQGTRVTSSSIDWIKTALQKRPPLANADSFYSTISSWAGGLCGLDLGLGYDAATECSLEALGLLIVLVRENELSLPRKFQSATLADLQDVFLTRLLETELGTLDECRTAALLAGLRVSRIDRLNAELQVAGTIDRALRDVLLLLEHVSRRFEKFARQLNKRHAKRVGFSFTDEYDVQDAFHAILRLHFEDVRPEECTPTVAGKSGRLDFLLPRHRIAIETKMTRKGLGRAELMRELGEDCIRFKKHPDVSHLFCFVYDPEKICDNPAAVEADISSEVNHPKVYVVVSSR